MDSFIFALSAVAPIVLLVALGYFLKRMKLMDGKFSKDANKLVFRVFMPTMLFRNIYHMGSLGDVDFGFVLYVSIALIVIFLVAIPFSIMVAKKKNGRGVLVQAAFRSGYSLIGIPLAASLYGQAGAEAATILSAAVIPIFNILAVISLTALGSDSGEKPSVKSILLGILKNPLILGIAAGLVCVLVRPLLDKVDISFRLGQIKPLFEVVEYVAELAIPMALLVLGAQFELSAVAELKREILFGTVVRTVIVPLIAIGIAFFFMRNQFEAAHFACFVSVFATPVAMTTVPMAQEMDGDAVLAGQLVVWSTLVSAFTMFLFTFVLRLAGAF
ncbi:MAG: AEC family transporter [Oscillospiraceae bacterium]|nr:AEC family transporter [Oscillospiraceae bacterium]